MTQNKLRGQQLVVYGFSWKLNVFSRKNILKSQVITENQRKSANFFTPCASIIILKFTYVV